MSNNSACAWLPPTVLLNVDDMPKKMIAIHQKMTIKHTNSGVVYQDVSK